MNSTLFQPNLGFSILERCFIHLGSAVRAIVFLAVLLPVTAAANTTLTFCYDPYPPYTFGRQGAPRGGISVRLLEAITARIDGLAARVVLLPWKRCQEQAKKGRVDGILPLFRNSERESYLVFSVAALPQTTRFWYARARFPAPLDWSGEFEDLAHLQLGMLNGGYVSSETEEAFSRGRKILRARDVESLMRLLLEGRVDLIAIEEAVGRHVMNTNGWQDEIAVIERPLARKMSYFGFSRAAGADRYVDAFNRVIAELERDGTISRILSETEYAD